MIKLISKLGPGLLFAGAAIGVSHLVQSTRAGADFGWGLIWALILVNIFKYPFFQYGPRYAMATGESLLDGYYKVGKIFLIIYFIMNLATMFTIQTAVTIVTAGLASSLFGITDNMVVWSLIITIGCYMILLFGRYQLKQELRYGENPHQSAAFYVNTSLSDDNSISSAEQIQGKELSYNNIADTDAAYELSLIHI